MKGLVDNLLKALHPDRSIHPWHQRAEEGLATFARPKGTITTLEKLADILVLFYWHIEQYLLNLNEPLRLNAEFTWGLVRAILQKLHGPSGHLAALDMVAASVEGGFPSLARAIAHEMADEFSTRHIRLQITAFWNLLSTSGRLAAGDEVISLLARLLPREVETSAARIRGNVCDFLAEYPRLIQRLEQRLPAP